MDNVIELPSNKPKCAYCGSILLVVRSSERKTPFIRFIVECLTCDRIDAPMVEEETLLLILREC